MMPVRRDGVLLLGVVLSAPACHRGGDDRDEDFTPAAAEASIGIQGGELALEGSDGLRYRLVVPTGAVSESVTFGLRTLEPTESQQFRVVIEPEGLLFARGLAASLTVGAREGDDQFSPSGIVYSGVPVPASRDPEGALMVALPALLGPAGTGARIAPEDCGAPPAPSSSEEGLSAQRFVDVELYIGCMEGAIATLEREQDFPSALRASLAITQLAQQFGNDARAQNAMFGAWANACARYEDALVHLTSEPIEDFGAVSDGFRRVTYWESVVQRLGADCAFDFDPQMIVSQRADEAAAFYETERAPIEADVDTPEHEAALEELGALSVVRDESAALAVPAFEQIVVERAITPLVDPLLAAPFEECRDTGDASALIALRDRLRGSEAQLDRAIQYCGTRLGASSTDAEGASLDEVAPALGGVRAGEEVTEGELQVQKAGSVTLTGPIRALACPEGTSDEQIELRVDGSLLQSFTPPAFGAPATWAVSNLLDRAGLSAVPEEELDALTLTLERSGRACGAAWGPSPSPLISLTLTFGRNCRPPTGAHFCVAPVEASGGGSLPGVPAGGEVVPVAMNDAGEVLLQVLDASGSDAGLLLWRAGSVRAVAPEVGAPSALNAAGAVAGISVSDDARVATADGVVVTLQPPSPPAGMQDATVLPGAWNGTTPLLHDDGAVALVAGVYGWMTDDSLAGCEYSRGLSNCTAYTVLRYMPPYSVPEVLMPWTKLDSVPSVRHIGADGTIVGALQGTAFGNQPQQWRPSLTLSTSRGEAFLRDDTGNTWWVDDEGDWATTRPVTVPAGGLAVVEGVNAAGFVFTCASGVPGLVNVVDGRSWSLAANDWVDPASTWRDTPLSCGDANPISWPKISNRHGQFVVAASRGGGLVSLILTPRGQPLP